MAISYKTNCGSMFISSSNYRHWQRRCFVPLRDPQEGTTVTLNNPSTTKWPTFTDVKTMKSAQQRRGARVELDTGCLLTSGQCGQT
uniref:Uncharacterized protein n=1 Tax=Romanomermis culicivorax TaxID=13658 RepID=A0A915IKW9_ROMCU